MFYNKVIRMKINIYRCFIITFLIFISIATFAETRNIVDESNSGNCEMMTLSSQGEEVLMNLSQRAAGVDSLRQLSEISQRQRRLVVGELTQERKAELWRVHFEEVKRSHFWTQDQAKIIEHLSDLSQKAHAVGKDSIFHETLVEAPLES